MSVCASNVCACVCVCGRLDARVENSKRCFFFSWQFDFGSVDAAMWSAGCWLGFFLCELGSFFFAEVGDEKRGCDNNGASILGCFHRVISCQ